MIKAAVVRIAGDNIDTDVLYPGPFLNIEDPEEMKAHLFEGLDPSLRTRLHGDIALVVDDNFGAGSSREHVVRAMTASGIKCVIARSFARIFFRNCINLGLLAFAAPHVVDAASDGETIEVDLASSAVSLTATTLALPQMPSFVAETIELGGFVPWARRNPPARCGVESERS